MVDKAKAREYKQKFIAKQREQSLCLECMNTVKPGCSRCQSCLDRRKVKNAEHRLTASERGMCGNCIYLPRLEGHRLCQKCYLRDVSMHRFKTSTLWRSLLERWELQGGRCAISGVPMTLGKDAELDHIVPTSRGGENILENTQWVLMVCNRMKDNLLEDEFLGLIERIYHTMKGRQETSP